MDVMVHAMVVKCGPYQEQESGDDLCPDLEEVQACYTLLDCFWWYIFMGVRAGDVNEALDDTTPQIGNVSPPTSPPFAPFAPLPPLVACDLLTQLATCSLPRFLGCSGRSGGNGKLTQPHLLSELSSSCSIQVRSVLLETPL